MSTIANLAAIMTLNTQSFLSGLQNAERQLKKVKSQFGKGSFLGGTTELLRGGGAVAGVTLLARTIDQAAERATELTRQFGQGEISAGQMTGELIRSVPVLGDMTKMWDSILGLIDQAKMNARGLQILDLGKLNRISDFTKSVDEKLKFAQAGEEEKKLLEIEKERRETIRQIRALQDDVQIGDDRKALENSEKKANQIAEIQIQELRNQAAKKNIQVIDEMIDGLKQQALSVGKSADEISLAKLATMGATKENIAYAQSLIDERIRIEELSAQHKQLIDLKTSTISRLKEEIATFGMNAAQIDDYKLAIAGAAQSTRDEVAALHAKADALKTAHDWIEKTQTPMERFKEQALSLREAFTQGLIDETVMGRAQKLLLDELTSSAQNQTQAEIFNPRLAALPGELAAAGIRSDADKKLDQANQWLSQIANNTSKSSGAVAR